MAKSGTPITEQIFEASFFVRTEADFEKIEEAQINTIPQVGHYWASFATKKIYNIEAIVHDDMRVYLILNALLTEDPYNWIVPKLYS